MDEAIYREHKDALVRYATVLAGPSNAEDIVSTVVARLYRSHRTLDGLDDPKPYLMKAVLNEAIDRGRRRTTLPLVDQAIAVDCALMRQLIQPPRPAVEDVMQITRLRGGG